MARIIETATADWSTFSPDQLLWAYNGLDCVVTRQVADALLPDLQPGSPAGLSYKFVRAMQGPALDMMMRGVRVQPIVRRDTERELTALRDKQQAVLNKLAVAVWGQPLNANSSKQMIAFFYDALGMTKHYSIRKTPQGKVKTLSCDHKALEALAKEEVRGPAFSPYDRRIERVRLAAPFVSLITTIRDTGKKLSVVRAGVSADGRFRCSYNVAGTVTGRWSSSKNVLNGGSNLQNITPAMRRMFCADDGFKMGAPDLEQAESRMVAGLAWVATGDDTYWRACESGDLHTIVCVMAYPERFEAHGTWDFTEGKFIGDLKACRAIADAKFYRHLSMRDIAKRIGHGSNYWGTAYGIAMAIGIPVGVVTEFQKRYFKAFPCIQGWHHAVINEVQRTHHLMTPLGRNRTFFGRVWDESVLREAIAHVPQSTIGELLNYMLYRVWSHGKTDPNFRRNVQLLLQNHDSFSVQYPTHLESQIVPHISHLCQVEVPFTREGETRKMKFPLEWKTGWNWANEDTEKRELFPDGNPDGLRKWKGRDERRRVQPAKPNLTEWLA